MSGELQKWNGNLPASLESKIQRWRKNHVLPAVTQPLREELAPQTHTVTRPAGKFRPGEVIWLPRLCALYGEGWVASYIAGADGRLSFMEAIRMPERLWRQHEGDTLKREVEVDDQSKEECPWCGATYRHWSSPVHCSGCGNRVCFGRTTADDYFRCYCGSEGKLRERRSPQFGFTPALRHGVQARH